MQTKEFPKWVVLSVLNKEAIRGADAIYDLLTFMTGLKFNRLFPGEQAQKSLDHVIFGCQCELQEQFPDLPTSLGGSPGVEVSARDDLDEPVLVKAFSDERIAFNRIVVDAKNSGRCPLDIEQMEHAVSAVLRGLGVPATQLLALKAA